MDEKKLCQILEESAEDVKIPEELYPENIEKRLLEFREDKREERRRRWKHFCRYGAAAAICLLVGSGIWRAFMTGGLIPQSEKMESGYDAAAGNERTMEAEAGNGTTAEGESAKTEYAWKESIYVRAEAFSEVYDSVIKGTGEKSLMSPGGKLAGGTEKNAAGGSVATDGRFIYAAFGAEVRVFDIREETPEFLGLIQPEREEGSSQEICLIYVGEGFLQVICSGSADEKTDGSGAIADNKVSVYTYRLKDGELPELTGVVEQDGAYMASIKSQGYLYLLTRRQIVIREEREQAVTPEGAAQWIPQVNGQICEPEQIWISGEGGTYAYLFSAVSDGSPKEAMDFKMAIAREAEVHTADESFYLRELPLPEQFSTWITKFQMDCGKIDVKRSLSVDENVEFAAVSDKYGCVVDNWEEGKMAILDFADAESQGTAEVFEGIPSPVFQEFWPEDRLLEIGWEEKADGRRGIRLGMMGLSEPEQVQEKHRSVFAQEDTLKYIDIASVVTDYEKGRIGFWAVTEENSRGNYLVYSYDEEQGFREILSRDLAEDFEEGERIRGIFVGDNVCLVSDKRAVLCRMSV